MSSANHPRKFSEKIAIMERKQNEENRQFEKIMSEVRGLPKPGPIDGAHQGTSQMQPMGAPESGLTLPPHGYPSGRQGGSLPNVHEMVHQMPMMKGPGDPFDPSNWPPGVGGSDGSRGGPLDAQWQQLDDGRVMRHNMIGGGGGVGGPSVGRGRSPQRNFHHHPYPQDLQRRTSPTGQPLSSPRGSSPYGTPMPIGPPQPVGNCHPQLGSPSSWGMPSYPSANQMIGHPPHHTLLQLPGDASWTRRAASDPSINSSLVFPSTGGGVFGPGGVGVAHSSGGSSVGGSPHSTHSPSGSATSDSPLVLGLGASTLTQHDPSSSSAAAVAQGCAIYTGKSSPGAAHAFPASYGNNPSQADLFAYGPDGCCVPMGGIPGGTSTPTGSLPNMASPLRQMSSGSGVTLQQQPPMHQQSHLEQQQMHCQQQDQGVPVSMPQRTPVQQRHSVQLPYVPSVSPSTSGLMGGGGGSGGSIGTQSAGAVHATLQAATPPYSSAGGSMGVVSESQSAPNSPANDAMMTNAGGGHQQHQQQQQHRQFYEQLPAQMDRFSIEGVSPSNDGQWPAYPAGAYSNHDPSSMQQYLPYQQQHSVPMEQMVSSPQSNQIPNIIFTGADGSISGQRAEALVVDCFSDIQNLDETELQQLLAGNQLVDSRIEEALRSDSN